MGNKTLTSVEWLISKLTEKPIEDINDEYWFGIIGQAKELEKHQHEISFSKGFRLRSYIHDSVYGGVEYWSETPKHFEDYYNDTYGEQA